MRKLFLLSYGEMSLKGSNKKFFEDMLIRNIKNRFKNCLIEKLSGKLLFTLESSQSDRDIIDEFKKIFGISRIAKVYETDLLLESIEELAVELLKDSDFNSFKVEAKRPNKAFAYLSPEINKLLGQYILENIEGKKVDVHNPDLTVYVEIRDKAFIYIDAERGAGGLPYGTSGKAVSLLSGGIDSPVSSWMMMKRGIEIIPVHFYSFPFTSERSKQKVIDITKELSRYSSDGIKLYIAFFTNIQKSIYENCPENYIVTIMRRMMMRIASRIAEKENAIGIITGENVGQVASQTLESMYVTNSVASMPVYRPVIGMDKQDIIKISHDIGTYDISIRPYEDCCTVFVPKHPVIKPSLERVNEIEKDLDIDGLVEESIERAETLYVR
ncbi:tRNA uracil 4-sulfurtransferase ThiI [Calorimonas adulescens]|uniref:Probable tRNA sulfurtransferase n=1 Tax=Calorimonas adulescens TaxID=2606906 RepID=A0A5D8QC19_9THEO|nr:tRNA uracil 4-sulfurtransferase ThiI [Calorimonas adulescens]TZE81937.1 tRNA 4-thiouridine(8) synthase ThiI [Calorimonas adulescens]